MATQKSAPAAKPAKKSKAKGGGNAAPKPGADAAVHSPTASATPEPVKAPGTNPSDAPIGAPLPDPHWPAPPVNADVNTQGASGTARKAPSAGSGGDEGKAGDGSANEPSPSGTQSAPPSSSFAEDGILVVVARSAKGMRRAGRSFTTEPTRIPIAELSLEHQEAIEGEPELRSWVENPDAE